ncbi:MAG: hypothetical protein V1694_00225 [Candidatus Eisenbacteria bacterium]|jgi:vacuolar-type H+-ATPase subunit F/Vma7
MARNEEARKLADRVFRAKEQRRRALASLTMEEKIQIVAHMQRIAEEIRTIARASQKP